MMDYADTQSKKLVESSHPLRVPACQVIVNRNDMHALAFERIQIGGERRNQRLTFTGLHLCDTPLMQSHATDELHIEVPHIESPLSGFADDRERFGQQVFERLSVLEALFEFRCLGLELLVGKGGNSGF